MYLRRELLKCAAMAVVFAGCVVGLLLTRAPRPLMVAAAVIGTAVVGSNAVLSFLVWRKIRSYPDLPFREFGFLWEAWKETTEHGRGPWGRAIYSDTPTERNLVELGLIKVIAARGPGRIGDLPLGTVALTFAELTPWGRDVLREMVRRDGGDAETLRRI